MSNITVTFQDGTKKQMHQASTAYDLVKSLSLKSIVLAKINGRICDLNEKLPELCNIELLTINSSEYVNILRHSCEHIMAASVCKLFKNVQFAMGPKNHSNNFYYDFNVARAFTPEDLVLIKYEMKKMINKKVSFKKSLISKNKALAIFKKLKQPYKLEILSWITDDVVSIYKSDNFIDLCSGPHLPHAGFIKAFSLLSSSGSYWRANVDNQMLQRITGIAFDCKKNLNHHFFKCKEIQKRDHRKLGQSLSLFAISKKFSTHNYTIEQNLPVFVSGKFNKQLNSANKTMRIIFKDNFWEKIEKIFNLSVEIENINFINLRDKNNFIFDVEIRIFISEVTSEQVNKLLLLEEEFNKIHKEGKLKINIKKYYSEEVGSGLVTWLPKGACLKNLIEEFLRKIHYRNGYEFISSPHIAKSELWKISGHSDFYKDNMFPSMIVDGKEYLLKPMNCPFHILAYKNTPKSYKNLPLRYAELGTVYRYEMLGTMHGLMRVRGFTQDDAHIFCCLEQVEKEIDKIICLVINTLKIFGFSKFEVNLSTRPEYFIGKVKEWQIAENALFKAVEKHNLPFNINKGGGAFYGPKIDIELRDCLDRSWQCSTIQLDFNNPDRFKLNFKNSSGQLERPVMLHRVLLGSIERFIGILIEEYSGAFPVWLAPEQIRIITIADRHINFAIDLKANLQKTDFRVGISVESEKLGAKIRQAQLEKIPIMLIIGDKEKKEAGVSVRLKSGENKGFMKIDNLIKYLLQESKVPN